MKEQDKKLQNENKETQLNTNRGEQGVESEQKVVQNNNTRQTAGGQYKGIDPEERKGSHKEGQMPHQSDDPTMHPSDWDEPKK